MTLIKVMTLSVATMQCSTVRFDDGYVTAPTTAQHEHPAVLARANRKL